MWLFGADSNIIQLVQVSTLEPKRLVQSERLNQLNNQGSNHEKDSNIILLSFEVNMFHNKKTVFKISIVFICFLLTTNILFCQKSLYEKTKLRNSEYLENRVKNITDEDLFESLDLSIDKLKNIKLSLENKNFQKAYEEWDIYWKSKKQPGITYNKDGILSSLEDLKIKIMNNPEMRKTIMENAEKVLNHEIKGWGDAIIKFGSIVDFNANYGKSGKYGFHYWGWSKPLIDAYLITGNMKYVSSFDELFNQWYAQRYRVTGEFDDFEVIFYELGLSRCKVFLSNYYFLSNERDWITHERMLKTMLGSGRWLYEVEKNNGYRAGNWQAVAAAMLAQIALTFPEFKESKEWIETSLIRIQEHLKNDFFDDGGHSERSPAMYTQLTYSQIRNLYFLLDIFKYSHPLKDEIKNLLSKTLDWWVYMLTPTGEMPAINDAHKIKFSTEVLNDGAELYRNNSVYGVLNALFGMDQYRDSKLPDKKSINLSSSGFAIMRSDWTPNALFMNINYGIWGGGHTHKDLLDFEIYANGEQLATDAGLGRTYDDPLYYPWYQTSNAHNMIVVNDSNMERKDIKGEEIYWSNLNNIDYFTGTNNGYNKFGITHKRHIIFIKPYFWLIFDQIKTEGKKNKITWNIHTLKNIVNTDQKYFRTGDEKGLIVYPIEKYLSATKKGFAMVKLTGTPDDLQEIPWLQFIKESDKDEDFSVLLYPYSKNNTDVTFLTNESGAFEITFKNEKHEIFIIDNNSKSNSIETDGKIVWIRKINDKIQNAALINGSTLKYKGEIIFWNKLKADYEK